MSKLPAVLAARAGHKSVSITRAQIQHILEYVMGWEPIDTRSFWRLAQAAPPAPLPQRKAYLVSFCVRDYYRREIEAGSETEAIANAQDLYDNYHEAAFDFDFTNGGTDDWQAELLKAGDP